jgi:hypothetical protein
MAPKKNDNTITINKEVKTKESKTKELKTKESKTKEPEESEEDSKSEEKESEEDSEEEESENEESENEELEDEELEDEESENAKKSVKEKKIKKTWQENINKLTQLTIDLKKNENENKLFQENLHKNEKTRSELIKEFLRVNALLPKSIEEGIKNASKKPKRKGTNSGGFKEGPIPPKLIKYLNLDNEIQMARPKVGSLLYNKFKSDNLTNGQNITFDKDTAKFFGKNKDYELNFKQFQTFLKEIYDEAFPKS